MVVTVNILDYINSLVTENYIGAIAVYTGDVDVVKTNSAKTQTQNMFTCSNDSGMYVTT